MSSVSRRLAGESSTYRDRYRTGNNPATPICWRYAGIARPLDDTSGITTTNMTVGTVAYAAPEQLMGEQLDGRSDQRLRAHP
jgi:serine/threonine protein kinase